MLLIIIDLVSCALLLSSCNPLRSLPLPCFWLELIEAYLTVNINILTEVIDVKSKDRAKYSTTVTKTCSDNVSWQRTEAAALIPSVQEEQQAGGLCC